LASLERLLPLKAHDWSVIIGTWFWSGLIRPAPGTFGSAAALPFAAAIALASSPKMLLPAALILFLVGWAASARIVRVTGIDDPQSVVIDEVVGIFITLSMVPVRPLSYAIGFLAFRLFDIVKPFPVGLADRRIGGGFGVMLDDAIAAAYALGMTAVFWHFLPEGWRR
jgi:phosphatidylglycerophosphatase A